MTQVPKKNKMLKVKHIWYRNDHACSKLIVNPWRENGLQCQLNCLLFDVPSFSLQSESADNSTTSARNMQNFRSVVGKCRVQREEKDRGEKERVSLPHGWRTRVLQSTCVLRERRGKDDRKQNTLVTLGWAKSLIIRPQESLALYKTFNNLWG